MMQTIKNQWLAYYMIEIYWIIWWRWFVKYHGYVKVKPVIDADADVFCLAFFSATGSYVEWFDGCPSDGQNSYPGWVLQSCYYIYVILCDTINQNKPQWNIIKQFETVIHNNSPISEPNFSKVQIHRGFLSSRFGERGHQSLRGETQRTEPPRPRDLQILQLWPFKPPIKWDGITPATSWWYLTQIWGTLDQ